MTNPPEMTPEQLNALLASAPDVEVQDVPVTIHTDILPHYVFVVKDIGGWSYHELGIYASGRWNATDHKLDVLIPYERVLYLQFDFETLKRFEEQRDGESASD